MPPRHSKRKPPAKRNTPASPPSYDARIFKKGKKANENEPSTLIRLNRFIANAGVCSRRDADKLIAAGKIRVNGKVVSELGYKVQSTDRVHYGDQLLKREKYVYVLLNKPKDFITTTDDPKDRKTVMQLVKTACEERIYPVGRLDRNTSGVLLLTNDGALSKKLTHPSHNVKKVYQLEVDKALESHDRESLLKGVELEDGVALIDELAILTPDSKTLGVEIHIGKNRIIRRLFQRLGYEVLKLDRVSFAGLTKKDIPRGKWRYLSQKEVIRLKHLSR